MKPQYKEQLERLAETLYEPFKSPQEQLDFDPNTYAEVADCIVERPLGRTALNRWDDMGSYTVDL